MKVRANASKRWTISDERMQVEERRLTAKVEARLRQVQDPDAETTRVWRQSCERRVAGGVGPGGKSGWRPGADGAFEGGGSGGRRRNPRGGLPYNWAYGERDSQAQSNFTDP